MGNIEIPNYEALIPNCTFGKQGEQFLHPNSRIIVPATQVIHVSRYRVPTRDEVMNLIRKTAYDCYAQQEDEENPLNDFFKMFPRSEVKKISKGDRHSMLHLREHYRIKKEINEREEGKSYIQFVHGIIPDEVLKNLDGNKLEERVKEVLYQKIIHDVGREEWYLVVRLEENKFPNLLELEYLIGHRVKDCDIFEIVGDCKYQKFADEMRIFCGVFGTQEDIEKIEDDSEVKLKGTAVSVIQDTMICLLAAKTLQGETRRMGINAEIINAQHPNLGQEDDESFSAN